MRSSVAIAVAIATSLVDAFPAVQQAVGKRATIANMNNEANSGFFPNTGYNREDQYVDVSEGSGHEWMAPLATDIRGPCPGLNAAANHGFLPRTGLLTLEDTVNGLSAAYNLGPDFSAPLFFFSTFNSGDLVQMKWSIGGPMPESLNGALGQGLGISNSHAKYEGDASPGRGDAYLHNGDAHSLQITNYQAMYDTATPEGLFTMATMRQHNVNAYQYSLMNNPHFFSGPVFFVPPIAHQFIVAMMSNYSEENIQGELTKDTLNSFFSVVDNDGQLEWVPGHERIPANWSKRPTANPYGIVASFGDFGLLLEQQPQFLRFGGNTGTVNSFAGVDPSDLSGGVYNSKNLLQGNNLACFAFQSGLAGMPEAAAAIGKLAEPFLDAFNSTLGPLYSQLSCPELSQYDPGAFDAFPGYADKQPIQGDTPY